MHVNRKLTATVVSSAIVAAALVPSMAAAKTVKVDMTQVQTAKGTDLTGTVKGKPFGKCTFTGKLLIPVVTAKWKCKGGTITLKTKNASLKGTFFVADAKLTGTGKYKKLKGKVKSKGSVTSNSSTLKGTASY